MKAQTILPRAPLCGVSPLPRHAKLFLMTQQPRPRPLPMALFAAASAAPLLLLVLAVMGSGAAAVGAFGYMALLSVLLDRLSLHVAGDAPEGSEFPAADPLLVVLGAGHLLILPMVTFAVAGQSGLPPWARVLLVMAAGLWLGQVGHPAAHELIHRGRRGLTRLGVAMYCAMLFGHHASAHRLVHHRHVATRDDPSTARSGEGFYRYALRAWTVSFRKGMAAESQLRKGRGLHPYVVYVGAAAVALVLAHLLAGWAGVAVWVGLSLHAQTQILLSDYVQHYGLQRRIVDGRPEPVGPQHSWNTPHLFSSALMLNAPRHSDHHAHPARPYPALRLPEAGDAPRLPWPMPVACVLALAPGPWRRAIRPHLARWKAPLAAT